jgi:hypothetical protein
MFSFSQVQRIYRSEFKNWEFDKEASQMISPERATIAERQGASEERSSVTKPTLSKTNF